MDIWVDRAVVFQLSADAVLAEHFLSEIDGTDYRFAYESTGMSALLTSLKSSGLAPYFYASTPRARHAKMARGWLRNLKELNNWPLDVKAALRELWDESNNEIRNSDDALLYILEMMAIAGDHDSKVLVWNLRFNVAAALAGSYELPTHKSDELGMPAISVDLSQLSRMSIRPRVVDLLSFDSRSVTADEDRPIKVFVSYSRADRLLIDQMVEIIYPLERQGTIEVWDDHRIEVGEDWVARLETELHSADAVLLFVSSEYLRSDFIQETELPIIQRRVEAGQLKLIWFLVSPCLYHETFLGSRQSFHPLSMPIGQLDELRLRELFVLLGERLASLVGT